MSKPRRLNVLLVKPGEDRPEPIWIYDTYGSIQKVIGGHFEFHALSRYVAVLGDEEGRLKGLPICRVINGVSYVGPLIVIGYDSDGFIQLGQKQLRSLQDEFSTLMVEVRQK